MSTLGEPHTWALLPLGVTDGRKKLKSGIHSSPEGAAPPWDQCWPCPAALGGMWCPADPTALLRAVNLHWLISSSRAEFPLPAQNSSCLKPGDIGALSAEPASVKAVAHNWLPNALFSARPFVAVMGEGWHWPRVTSGKGFVSKEADFTPFYSKINSAADSALLATREGNRKSGEERKCPQGSQSARKLDGTFWNASCQS